VARMKRLVVPGYPHHVTQRGNRRQLTFFSRSDYEIYVALLSEAKNKARVEIWAYCLMPNHVHFVVVPEDEDGLANLFKEAHRRYTRHVNARNDWQGHLWQERFHSFVMDDPHLISAVRYVEQNPVRAELCDNPADWQWSSAKAHLSGRDDGLVSVEPMLKRFPDWKCYLGMDGSEDIVGNIHRHSSTGRPAGTREFVAGLEQLTGRTLWPKVAGRRKRAQ